MDIIKSKKDIIIYVSNLIRLIYFEIIKENPFIKIKDIEDYILKVILIGKKIKNFNDLTYHVMNIKINKLIEFINVDVLLDKTDTIDLDLKDIEGK